MVGFKRPDSTPRAFHENSEIGPGGGRQLVEIEGVVAILDSDRLGMMGPEAGCYEAAARLHRTIRGDVIKRHVVQRIRPAGLTRRESTGSGTNRDPVVAKALHLIDLHPSGGLSVEELAGRVGVSRRKFEQRFRLATGITPHAAILQRRLDEAKHLLRVGQSSMVDIAEACGFSSVHYFTTASKRGCGRTPGGFRKESGGGKRQDR